jgi:uncharacterized protein (TIGR03435 family)
MTFRLQMDEIVEQAYSLKSWELVGPAWLTGSLYEMEAIMPPGSGKEDGPAMVRTMLTERFGFRYHYESRDLPALALIVGPHGFPFRAVPDTGHPHYSVGGSQTDALRHLTAKEMPIESLVQWLTNATGQTVVDRTGITGLFDLDLSWTPDWDGRQRPRRTLSCPRTVSG